MAKNLGTPILIDGVAWIGTALLCAAPFFIDTDAGKLGMVAGLTLLSLQAYTRRLWNLILLNTIGGIGYAFNFLF